MKETISFKASLPWSKTAKTRRINTNPQLKNNPSYSTSSSAQAKHFTINQPCPPSHKNTTTFPKPPHKHLPNNPPPYPALKASNPKENFTGIHNRQEKLQELCNSITTILTENGDTLEDFELRGEVFTLAEGDVRILRILEMNEKLNIVSGYVQWALDDLEERVRRELMLSDSSDDDDDL
jgi:hypothetical protein